jgi:hypothetical protein
MKFESLKSNTFIVFAVGFTVRIALALFAGHSYDLALFAYSTRLFYETRTFDVYFPTLPITYYAMLASYGCYTLLRDLGLHDLAFLNHPQYMVEGLFLKLPMILTDSGIFLVICRFTRRSFYGALWFLNPLPILVSAAWGMYDSLMIFPMTLGFLFLARKNFTSASFSFVISGLVKLFGFMPFTLLLITKLIRREWREAALEVGIALLTIPVVFLPFFSTIQDYFLAFVFRVLGISGAETRAWNVFTTFQGANVSFGGGTPLLGPLVILALALFVFEQRGDANSLPHVLRWSVVAASLSNIFSQAEPQWLVWVVPLAIMYGFEARKQGLVLYSYLYGVAAAFLITTLYGSGYLLTGSSIALFGQLEMYNGRLAIYAATALALQIILLSKVFLRRKSAWATDIGLIVVAYLASFVTFAIFRL